MQLGHRPTLCVHACMLSCFSHVQLSVTPWTIARQASLSMDSPGKNTRVGCHAPLQGLFLTQGLTELQIYKEIELGLVKEESESVICSVMSNSVIPWTIAHQAPLGMEFSRQEYWSGLPFPSPGDLPDRGIEPRSPALQADSLPAEQYWVII